MMASSRGRDRSSPWDGRGFGRIGCLLHQAEEHAIMNRAETEDGSYASGRNRKLLAEWAAKAGENEYAEPALNPCQTTAYAFFTGDQSILSPNRRESLPTPSAGVRISPFAFAGSRAVSLLVSCFLGQHLGRPELPKGSGLQTNDPYAVQPMGKERGLG